MPLDVEKIDRRADIGVLIETPRKVPDGRVIDDRAPIAFEMAVIDGIEAHERRERADVGLGQRVADEIRLAR